MEPDVPPDSSESEIEKWKRKHEEQRREYDQMKQERARRTAEREAAKVEKQRGQAVPKTVMEENIEKLAERDDKLKEAAETTGRLRDDSSLYRDNSRKLLEQQQQQKCHLQ